MEGTDPARLADCLGLDPSRFHGSAGTSAADAREDALVTGSAYFEDEDRFKVRA
jgi:DNA polymerase alpha subunit A